MTNTQLKEERKFYKRKPSDTLILLYVLTFILIFVGQLLGVLLEFIPFFTSSDAAITAVMYLEFIGIWIITLLYMRFTKKNRSLLSYLGTKIEGNN